MKNGKFRLNLELSSEIKELLDKATASSGAASNTEVIRRSIALFSVAMDHGGIVYVENKDGEKEKIMLL